MKLTMLIMLLALFLFGCIAPIQPEAMSPSQEQGTAECPHPDDGTNLFVDGALGVCFLYPAGYSVERPLETSVAVFVGSLLNVSDPRADIEVEYAPGRTLDEATLALAAEFPGFELERSAATVDGEPAIVFSQTPGQEFRRLVLVAHEGRIYQMSFMPDDPTYGDLHQRMISLYDTIVGSLHFLPPAQASENHLSPEDERIIVANMSQFLAQQVNAQASDVVVVALEQMLWPDACLGAGLADEGCALVQTPGFRLTLAVNGAEYTYHTDPHGYQIRLVAAPTPTLNEPALIWTGPGAMGECQTIAIADNGLAFGRCGAVQMGGYYTAFEKRKADLAEFVESFASFAADTPTGSLVFTGRGNHEAAPAQQRMIAEWANLVMMEATAGRACASCAQVIAWQRQEGQNNNNGCQRAAIYLTGEFYLDACAPESPASVIRLRLQADELEQVYSWIDTLAPFDEETDEAGVVVKRQLWSIGLTPATQSDKKAMDALIMQVIAQTAAP